MTPSPEAIDIYRLRELIRTAATLREPNWRSMLTQAGEAAQAELKELWGNYLRMLQHAEREMQEEK